MGNLIRLPSGRWVDMESKEFDPTPADPFTVCDAFLREPPDLLVIGGLGDCDDITPALKRWPSVVVMGIDPDTKALEWQRKHCWPKGDWHPLYEEALSHETGYRDLALSTVCCASFHKDLLSVTSDRKTVITRRLDEYKVWEQNRIILWLDLEGWEYNALLGADRLLRSGRVELINVEVRYSLDGRSDVPSNEDLRALLTGYGYEHCVTWFRQWWGANELWRKQVR